MGSRLEERELAKHMPISFKDACPVCHTPWTVKTVDHGKQQIECLPCLHDRVVQSKIERWWAVSGSYASGNWPWEKLWRQFVHRFGLSTAVEMCPK